MTRPESDEQMTGRFVLDRLAFPMQNIASFLDDLLQDEATLIDEATRHKLCLIRNELRSTARETIAELRPKPEGREVSEKIEAA
ncbi:MAG: hypothetical protein AAGE80_04005 [Pseudomonadota bacterium]